MDKRTLYDSFTKLELDTDATLRQITALKTGVEELVEENAILRIENQHLRDRLSDIEKQKQIDEEVIEPEMTKSRMNLEKLYEDGFHVCNVFYGSRRVDDEPCAFCLDVIYGERK